MQRFASSLTCNCDLTRLTCQRLTVSFTHWDSEFLAPELPSRLADTSSVKGLASGLAKLSVELGVVTLPKPDRTEQDATNSQRPLWRNARFSAACRAAVGGTVRAGSARPTNSNSSPAVREHAMYAQEDTAWRMARCGPHDNGDRSYADESQRATRGVPKQLSGASVDAERADSTRFRGDSDCLAAVGSDLG